VPQVYNSLDQVYQDVKRKYFTNENTFRQAFVEALKYEIEKICSLGSHKNILRIMLDNVVKGRKPDVSFANVVMELEVPPEEDRPITRRKIEAQLKPYMEKIAEPHLIVEVLGLATNGWRAELWRLKKIPLDGETEIKIEKVAEGPMPEITRHLLRLLCSDKISILSPDDLVAIFGV